MLHQINVNLTPDFNVSTKKCNKVGSFPSFLQSGKCVEYQTMQRVFENIAKNKLGCVCQEDVLEMNVGLSPVILFNFTNPICIPLQISVTFCGHDMNYVAHVKQMNDSFR